MATKTSPPPAASAPTAEQYLPGDPIPAAEVSEADSDSVWALFSETPGEAKPEFPPTQRAPL